MSTKQPERDETIAAVATPAGEGALGIIRISGTEALTVGDRAFRGKVRLPDVQSHTVHHGRIVDPTGNTVDEVLVAVFRGPHSYTGEDVVEIGCHGGSLQTSGVLRAVLAAGARPAQPGEFTRRAFLNRKMDLTQAEAVADLIAARSARAQRNSLDQLQGKLAAQVGTLARELLDLRALLELDLDFSEEGLDVIGRDEIGKRLEGIDGRLYAMEKSFATGRLLKEGVSVVLAGKPNVGKSSLFNALLEEERAIVTHIPGTTRDSLEEGIAIRGVLFKLKDTAGLRHTFDPVESEGVKRSREALRLADIVLLVTEYGGEGGGSIDDVADLEVESRQFLVVARNKVDLHPGIPAGAVKMTRCGGIHAYEIPVSALTGEGLEELRETLFRTAMGESGSEGESVQITSARQLESVRKSRANLFSAMEALRSGMTNEFVAFDVSAAAQALSEITGEVTSDDVLNHIFSRFCIGK